MSDHLHGSEQYYLKNINDNLTRFAERVDELAAAQDVKIDRLLDAFRHLNNIETEAMAMLRELQKQRDNEARQKMRGDFKIAFEIALGMRKCPDEVEMYVSELYDGALYDITGALLKITEIVTEVAAVRERRKRETEALLKQDARTS